MFRLSVTQAISEEGGGTPYDGLHGEAPPGRRIFFRLQVHERYEFHLSFGSVKGHS